MGFGAGGIAVVAYFAKLYLLLIAFSTLESIGLYAWSRRPAAWTPIVLVAPLPLGWLWFITPVVWVAWLSRRPRREDDRRPATWLVLVLALTLLVIGATALLFVALE
ncbi:MAG: hypothetical protein AAGE94_07740 [Acidobacteriota bacterium]